MKTAKFALILAAGNGSRIAARSGEGPKPLVSLNRKPLLEHVMSIAREASVERFVIVLGYRGQDYANMPSRRMAGTWATARGLPTRDSWRCSRTPYRSRPATLISFLWLQRNESSMPPF
jgi:bifunctional N-acetylglucosamine-1-phosphate-uridyltransferase/glucosamine-1-phosphate-acetyltransferase GlmU-like protein